MIPTPTPFLLVRKFCNTCAKVSYMLVYTCKYHPCIYIQRSFLYYVHTCIYIVVILGYRSHTVHICAQVSYLCSGVMHMYWTRHDLCLGGHTCVKSVIPHFSCKSVALQSSKVGMGQICTSQGLESWDGAPISTFKDRRATYRSAANLICGSYPCIDVIPVFM